MPWRIRASHADTCDNLKHLASTHLYVQKKGPQSDFAPTAAPK